MNKLRKYINEQKKKRREKKRKKVGFGIFKVLHRIELSFPVIGYLIFVGAMIYLITYQAVFEVAVTIDFVIAVMSVAVMLLSYVRESLKEKSRIIYGL